jgi:hypothetical protein
VTVWTWAWIGWLGYFAVVEGAALYRSKPGDTLSEHVWMWANTTRGPGPTGRQPSGWTRLRRVLLLAGVVWLGAHFLTGGWA